MIRPLLFVLMMPAVAQAACRQALSLGLDVSSSVDASEYRLQLDGLIAALNAPVVVDILFMRPDAPVRLHVYEWSGPEDQTEIVPWTTINTATDLASVTARLRGHTRSTSAPKTALGSAMLAGFAFLQPHADCWIRTLDLSGDGEANTGPLPEDIPHAATPAGVTVNGLVVGSGNFLGDTGSVGALADLTEYYTENVIRGPEAFVELAQTYADYADAMERKLLRELTALTVGQSAPLQETDG